MRKGLSDAIVQVVYSIDGEKEGLNSLHVITKELDRLKSREVILIQTLNELYDAANNYYDDYGKPHCAKLEDALHQADKVLEGN